ncbi:MAG: hypothetical protein CVV64_17000 [Candidatus Wallbacteria bacterium HGW-Wallbacteria-1]|uniref:Uncharacterized protein n=1 Tax=Candidatus Wallbacteria bacterium HGW-Wallbacteria-1 TaxID=2013854 RepID=A0A2N1PKI8_9BACT|nr:MAG: hypothetical protein CVV64_17000 [Candidatus Wallbacteria bacterium HGW-Wallbacteria-1]
MFSSDNSLMRIFIRILMVSLFLVNHSTITRSQSLSSSITASSPSLPKPPLSISVKEKKFETPPDMDEIEKAQLLATRTKCRKAVVMAEQAKTYLLMWQSREGSNNARNTYRELSWNYLNRSRKETSQWIEKKAALNERINSLEKKIQSLSASPDASRRSLSRFKNYLNSARYRIELGDISVAEHFLDTADDTLLKYATILKTQNSWHIQATSNIAEATKNRLAAETLLRGLKFRKPQEFYHQANEKLDLAKEKLNSEEFENATKTAADANKLYLLCIQTVNSSPKTLIRTAELVHSISSRAINLEPGPKEKKLRETIAEIEFLMDSGEIDKAYREASNLYSALTFQEFSATSTAQEKTDGPQLAENADKAVKMAEKLLTTAQNSLEKVKDRTVIDRIAKETSDMISDFQKKSRDMTIQEFDRARRKIDTMAKILERAMAK